MSEGFPSLLQSSQAPPVRTLVDIVRQTALTHPDASALDNGSNVLTYEEFCESADAFASALRERGVGRGDRVGVRVDSGTLDLYVAIMDTVSLEPGSTLGPHSVILPAATIGAHASIGPVSLVMRGESVPKKTRWIGNPIGPWAEDDIAAPR